MQTMPAISNHDALTTGCCIAGGGPAGMMLGFLLEIGRRPKADKEVRMSRHEGRFEAGNILLPKEAAWLADFEAELLSFPSGRYDDQVDALLLLLDWFPRVQHYDPPMTLAGLPIFR